MEITIGDFTSVSDLEKSRYLLLNKFKFCEMEFNQSRLYPTYQMLINIHQQLVDIMNNHSKIYNKEYTDALSEEETAEKQKIINDEIEKSFELMHWAFSHLNKTLETGRAIYDFVDESINIESIGISSEHNKEGYFVVPNNQGRILKVIKYEKNLYKILKTKEVGNYEFNIILIPKAVVRNYIISEDILNQIIYYLDTELSFPFSQTILPVAKRKFLNFLETNSIN
ncbi:MAG: hypothetical protein L0Y79_08655 [Chlorobi bacterium]|nr:hypothetical protein [Chlorobiota bacterium]MCI0716378.1 hypothetical protein [Chlorobiota bacterium]